MKYLISQKEANNGKGKDGEESKPCKSAKCSDTIRGQLLCLAGSPGPSHRFLCLCWANTGHTSKTQVTHSGQILINFSISFILSCCRRKAAFLHFILCWSFLACILVIPIYVNYCSDVKCKPHFFKLVGILSSNRFNFLEKNKLQIVAK